MRPPSLLLSAFTAAICLGSPRRLATRSSRAMGRLRGGWNTWGSGGGSSWNANTQGTQNPFGGGASASAGMSKKPHNPEGDPEIPSPPSDGITDMSFSPSTSTFGGKFLVASSWDKTIRCWEVSGGSQQQGVGQQVQAVARSQKSANSPLLCCGWSSNGGAILYGGCDGVGYMWSLQNQQVIPVARHSAPIRKIFWSDIPRPCVITASFDGTIKFWSAPFNGVPFHTITTPGKVHAIDVRGSVLVVGTSEKKLVIYNLNDLSRPFKEKFSPLKSQIRSIGVFSDQSGCCIGAIEGRVSVENLKDQDASKNFAFKCHRVNTQTNSPNKCEVYPVNDIAFHPAGTLATVGADGTFCFWDKDAKSRLKVSGRSSIPFSSCCFNHDGTLFAYAACYDWHQGHVSAPKFSGTQPSAIMIRPTRNEATPKPPTLAPTSYRW
ncbi:hypothetical protein AAMO2058_000842300 [Amorphochlora amoebiformis]